MFDRRTGTFDTVNPFLFEADFADGLKIEVQVNSEFETPDSAEAAALIYLYAVGQLPTELRQEVDTIWLHKGDEDFGGGGVPAPSGADASAPQGEHRAEFSSPQVAQRHSQRELRGHWAEVS